MVATTTESRPNVQPPLQPNFWKRYSPRGECPMSFTGSALFHVLVPLAFVAALWLSGQVGDNESARPVRMDMVELEGGGGGLGEIGLGAGKGEPGKFDPTEIVNREKPPTELNKFKDEAPKLKLPLQENPIVPPLDPPVFLDPNDPFAKMLEEQRKVELLLSKEFNPAAKPGSGTSGPSGGTKGPGAGSQTGPSKGLNPKGNILTQQRRRELRWEIRTSDNPEIHLKKLQALKVLLVVPMSGKPGRALQFDLSKPTVVKEEIWFKDDQGKVRWWAQSVKGLQSLAAALQLPETPGFAVIYLPVELERDMAERELAYQQRQEHEIKLTIWDVRRVDDTYENVPFILQQILWRDMK